MTPMRNPDDKDVEQAMAETMGLACDYFIEKAEAHPYRLLYYFVRELEQRIDLQIMHDILKEIEQQNIAMNEAQKTQH